MPRGQQWQTSYDPDRNAPTTPFDLKSIASPDQRIAEKRIGSAHRIRKIVRAVFRFCDLPARFTQINFDGCTFEECDFDRGLWKSVKFSNCTFIRCNLSMVAFQDCTFLDCSFEHISVSAELLRFESTSIDPTRFLSAVTVRDEPGATREHVAYQRFRLTRTKAKVAHTLLVSTRDEPDPTLFFEANREFVLATLAWKYARPAYVGLTREQQPLFSASLKRIPVIIEMALVRPSGWLTGWGSSIARPGLFFLAVACIFAIAYRWAAETCWPDAIVRSLDVSLVVGYTRYAPKCLLERIVGVANVLLGVYWYSLFVPTLVRRTIR